MVAAPAAVNHGTFLLGAADVERVIAIDRAHSGHSRRDFFEKRFAAATSRPEDFIHLGVHRGGALRGFVVARILRGEFGREDATAVIDAIGVEPQTQRCGVGQALIAELMDTLARMGVRSLQSQADWTNRDLVRFFAGCRFTLAPRLALERPVAEPLDEAVEAE